MKEKIKNFCDTELNVPAVGYFWKGFALFLLGVVVGFLLAPIKKGVKMGCGNGCNNGNNCTASGNALKVGDEEDEDTAGDSAEEEDTESKDD